RLLDDAGRADRGDSIGRVTEVLAEDFVGMLAQHRSGAVDLAGSRGKLRQQSCLIHAAPLRMRQLGSEGVRDNLGIVEQLTRMIYPRSRDGGFLQCCESVVTLELGKLLRERRRERTLVRRPRGLIPVAIRQ